MKTLEEIALELLNSEHCNGWGVKCGAISDAMEKYNVTFKELWSEIVKRGNAVL